MKLRTILFITTLHFLLSCEGQKTTFDEIALEEIFTQTDESQIQFKEILEKNKGKTIFIDIWASWCSDCVAGIPELKKLQAKEKELEYVLLSLDKTKEAWKDGIKKHQLVGQHYLFTKKWKQSKFCESINLDWIPRYIIVGKNGTIKMYKATKISDKTIQKTINEDK